MFDKLRDAADRITIPKSNGLGAGDLVKDVVAQIDEDNVKAHAGNLAYRSLFAMFAVLILLFSVLGIFQAQNLVDRMVNQMQGFLPDPVTRILENQVLDQAEQSAPERAPALRGIFAILGSLYGLSALARGVIDAMNAMYRVEEKRPFWKRQSMSIVIALFVLALLIGAVLLVAVGPRLDPLFRVARWPVLLALVLLSFALVYYFGPSVKERFRFLSHGSIIMLPIWIAFSLLFTLYIDRFSDFEQTYGPLAGIVVLLLYVFVSSLILLTGAEVNHVVARHVGRSKPEPAD